MKHLDSVIKAETHFATEVCSVKDMIFPVIMYRCVIWTIRKGECQTTELLNCGAWEILESSLYKEIKPVNLKGNQLLTPAVSAEASTEGL